VYYEVVGVRDYHWIAPLSKPPAGSKEASHAHHFFSLQDNEKEGVSNVRVPTILPAEVGAAPSGAGVDQAGMQPDYLVEVLLPAFGGPIFHGKKVASFVSRNQL
jgi:hypothetical protein